MKLPHLVTFGMSLPPDPVELDTLAMFDDRTLASLIGSRHSPLSDGVDNADATRALRLERWMDR